MGTPLLALSDTAAVLLSTGAALLLLVVALGVWLRFGRGARRSRAFARGRRLLHQGDWEGALAASSEAAALGRLSPTWEGRLRNLEGEAHHSAGDAALKARQFEDAAQHFATAAGLLRLDAGELRSKVVEAMLAEARRLYAEGPAHNEAARRVLERALALRPHDPAILFWQGLCLLRDGQLDRAAEALVQAHERGKKAFVDPPLYLGMIALRQGKPQEALRHLADANRVDPKCPFVPLHMGLALVASGGDASLAIRALGRAVDARGLGQWVGFPARAWYDGMPEGKSFLRRFAADYAFSCPLYGPQVGPLVIQGRLALGQAAFRQENYQQAADVFDALLKDSPPSASLLRGLGLALAKLGRYDQAYKHLRTAVDLEPNDVKTVGHLALCGALGKPTQADDKPRNVLWAVQQVARYEVYGDEEWAKIASRILAEARSAAVPIDAADQARLCDVLVSVFATDPEAAAAYEELAATAPAALRPEHAWVWCQAAHLHGLSGRRDLELFATTFADVDAAAPFYRQRGWDIEAVEFSYLERSARFRPGRFPEELGPYYPDRGAGLLLRRAKACEVAGDLGGATATAEVLFRLAPTFTLGHDRLARLYFRTGRLDESASLLAGWHRLEPTNPLPLVRRAAVEAKRGNDAGRAEALRLALAATTGTARGEVALLGARLAVGPAPREAEELARECLKEIPDQTEALWLLAALRGVAGDRAGLADLAPALRRADVADGRYHFLAAVAHLAAGDAKQALESCRLAWAEPALTAECRHLMAEASRRLGDDAAAAREWEVVARTSDSPSAATAQAQLGRLRFLQGQYEEALPWWTGLDAAKRSAWGLDEPLRAAAFLAGLEALAGGRYERAAERFREAGRLGLRDRRIGPLLVAALVKAGEEKLFGRNGAFPTTPEKGHNP